MPKAHAKCRRVIRLASKDRAAWFELGVQEIEFDRARGASVSACVKTAHVRASFFGLWLEACAVERFAGELASMIRGEANAAELHRSQGADLYLKVLRKDGALLLGLRVETFAQVPVGLRESLSTSFELEPGALANLEKEMGALARSF